MYVDFYIDVRYVYMRIALPVKNAIGGCFYRHAPSSAAILSEPFTAIVYPDIVITRHCHQR